MLLGEGSGRGSGTGGGLEFELVVVGDRVGCTCGELHRVRFVELECRSSQELPFSSLLLLGTPCASNTRT